MNKHILRRLLLTIMRDHRPALLDPTTARMHPQIQMAAVSDQVADTLVDLAGHGFAVNKRPGRTPLYAITAAGLDQINQETDLDEFVWGEHASRFQ